MPSLAYRFALVAAGELDFAIAGPGSHDWDLAAADLLVHEAGGAVTDLAGRPLATTARTPPPGVDRLQRALRPSVAALVAEVERRLH